VSKRTPVEVTWALRAEHHLVRGDEVQLRQVFVNLAMNAFQAMNGGGKQVSIHTHSDDTHLLVDVVDEGEGIAEETRDEIFRPFFTSKPRGSGTGLGLPTARRITEMHGGSLDLLESRPGRTVFQVRLRHDGSAVPFRDPLSAATLVPATDGGGAPRCP
jgi:two-component system sensor kinase FixL